MCFKKWWRAHSSWTCVDRQNNTEGKCDLLLSWHEPSSSLCFGTKGGRRENRSQYSEIYEILNRTITTSVQHGNVWRDDPREEPPNGKLFTLNNFLFPVNRCDVIQFKLKKTQLTCWRCVKEHVMVPKRQYFCVVGTRDRTFLTRPLLRSLSGGEGAKCGPQRTVTRGGGGRWSAEWAGGGGGSSRTWS